MKNNFLAILACFVFLLLALFSAEGFTWKNLRYSGNAITTDEMAHIPSGYYYLKTGKYFLNPEHPPLVKDVSALSLIFLNPVFPEIDKQEDIQEWFAWYGYPPAEFIFSNNLEIKNAQWDFSGIFLFNPKNDPDKIAFFARLSVILFNSILLFLLYRSVLLLWGNRAAILALALIVFSQFNIAHGSLVTMDFMSSILQMLAVATFSIYIKRLTEDKNSIFFFILTLGYLSLALLAKFSSLILIPFLFLGGIVFILMRKKLRFLSRYLIQASLLILGALSLVSIYYYFHTSNMDGNDLIKQIDFLHPGEFSSKAKSVTEAIISVSPVFKGLVQYINGVWMVFSRMDISYQKVFFMGKIYGSEGAGLAYFPVLYFAKLPVGLLILNFIALGIFLNRLLGDMKWRNEISKRISKDPLAFLLLIFILFFISITFSSDLQIGLRHIMPVIFATSLLTAKGIASGWNSKILRIKVSHVFSLAFFAMIVSVLFAFPNYISFYNLLFGGTDNGYKIATDSNFDWGQDTKKLVEYVEKNNIKNIYVDLDAETFVSLGWYLKDNYKEFDIDKNENIPSGSYLALSAVKYEINKNRDIFLNLEPVARVGKTIFIFKMSD